MKENTQTYLITDTPPDGFPFKKGAKITMPSHHVMFEYHDGNGHIKSVRLENCDFAKKIRPKNKVTLINIPDETTQEKYEKCTLTKINYYYDHYGYLEDYQIKWLIVHLKDALHHLKRLTDDVEDNAEITYHALNFLTEL